MHHDEPNAATSYHDAKMDFADHGEDLDKHLKEAGIKHNNGIVPN